MDEVIRNNGGRWQKGQSANPKGRPPGRRDTRTIVLEALHKQFGGKTKALSEQAFWGEVLTMARSGESSCYKLLADRLAPPIKSRPQPLTDPITDLPDELSKKAECLVDKALSGELAVEDARSLLSGLGDVIRIRELTELEERLIKLEDAQHARV